ncbi:MAG: (Fe-S)-binding protein [Myxococcota bacterium]|nr:(Fe-S)-binding protein [Myxococcota bacterium]
MEPLAPFPETLEEIREAGGDVYRLCYQCGKCDTVCPWNDVRRFSIRRIIRQASFGLTEVESEEIWRCTTCGRCPQECPRGVQQIHLGVALRRIASRYEVFPASARSARAVRAGLRLEGNPLNEERRRRADWAQGLPVKPFTEGTKFLYFVGCYLSYDPRLRRVAAATARLLHRAGVDFGILGERESCCGESVRKTGAEDLFRSLARENIRTFIEHGVTRIVVSSPHCYHTFKNEYSEFMVQFEVLHVSQLLLQLLEQGRLTVTRPYPKKVAYHDPCYLGRHNGIYDPPREILRRIPGLDLIELPAARQESLCCGGGGGRIWMDAPKGERFADLRLAQAARVGAEELATCCPYCITMFEEARKGPDDDGGAAIRDVTEILEAAI